MRVWAHIATVPSRAPCIKQVLRRLADQVDGFFLFFDQCNAQKTHDSRLALVRLHEPDAARKICATAWGNRGSWGKFYFLRRPTEYPFNHDDVHLMCDDDLSYTHDYTKPLLRGLFELPDAVVAVQGYALTPKGERSKDTSFYAWHTLQRPQQVHVVGTGACAFRHDRLGDNFVAYRHEATRWSADVAFALWAQNHGVPFVLWPHGHMFRSLPGSGEGALVRDPRASAARRRLIQQRGRTKPWRLYEPVRFGEVMRCFDGR